VDVRFSEEEVLLRDSILAQAVKLTPTGTPALDDYDDRPLWDGLAAAGTLGLGVDEALGGAGTAVDAALVAMALGRALAPVPYLGCGVLPAHLLALAGADPALIDAVVAGRRRLAVGLDPDSGALAAWGAPALAWDAAGAEAALVRRDGRIAAVALGPPAAGVDLTRRVRWCEPGAAVRLEGAGALSDAAEARWLALACCLAAADTVGVMEGALALAVEHARTREQFGVPIGTFQAIQHLLADQHTSLEGARAVTVHAAWALDHRDPVEAELAAHTAKAYCSDAGKRCCEAVVQVHGGMGMTWECRAHVFLKRVLLDRAFQGDERVHFRRIAELRGREADGGL